MVEILLIVVIILLIIIRNKIKSSFNVLNNNLKVLNRKISALNTSEEEQKPATTETSKKPIEPISEEALTPEFKTQLKPKKAEIQFEETAVLSTSTEVKEESFTGKTQKIAADSVITYTLEQREAAQKTVEKETVNKPASKPFWERFKEKNPDLEKFIGENLINKIGILILVLGISYFVKYAIDKNWINEPARVGIGVLCGSLVLLIANKLRKKYAAFSSVLVAGAIAIFYFTIAIAFHEYKLFSQEVAFAIMVVITAFSCVISLSYNRIELAVLSLIGGFAVPFMVSTGSGNYVVLFTYIIILNIGIILMAFYKKWRLVNTLAFIFTVFLFGGWFIIDTSSKTPHYIGGLLFAFAFYLIFILTNIINNLRTKAVFTKRQLAILFAATVFFFTVGMVTLTNYHPEFRGLFTAGLALINLVLAWFLYKKFSLDKSAIYMLIGLTLTFITLAIPIQFKGNYITLFWAAEAVLLMWLGQKSSIKSYRFSSIIVHVLAFLSLFIDWYQKYNEQADLHIVFNTIFATGIFVVATLFLTSFLLKKETTRLTIFKFVFDFDKYRKLVFIAGIVLLYFVGLLESLYQSDYYLDNINSALSIPSVYHLVYTGVIAFILFRRKKAYNIEIANIIACINIVLFAFVFLSLVFEEHSSYLYGFSTDSTAFYLHYIMLVITIFFGVLHYILNKEKPVFKIFRHKIFVWISAFFIVFIASSEVLLHGLKILTDNVQTPEVTTYYKIDLAQRKVIKTAFPVLWGILAFIFLVFGIKKQIKSIRIIALVILGITIIKLFSYDINNISETGKIIAFILLGVLILIISFVYQKIKVLVIDDDKKEENKHNTDEDIR